MGKIDTSLFPMEIGRLPKTKTETFIVAVNEFQGKMYIDARIHVNKGRDEFLPTKKGITMNLKTFEPIVQLLLDAYKALQELQKQVADDSENDVFSS